MPTLDLILQIVLICTVLFTVVMLIVLWAKQRETVKELADIKLTLVEAFKHLDKPLADALSENRRNNRLISELLALKQAEMTGDFEIVEEPVAPPPPTVKMPNFKGPGAAGKDGKMAPPPQSFPKIG
jgi:hypothetical protein